MTNIEWTDATWNPTRGCSRVSEGCRHCYAERQAYRVNAMQRAQGNPEPYAGLVEKVGNEPRWTGEVELVREKLLEPLGWRLHRKVFVNSMSDLFHESLSNEEIAAVFGAMVLANVQTFQVLTKRATRLPMWNEWIRAEAAALLGSVAARPRSGSAVATACVLYLMNVVDPDGAGIKKESAWLNAAAGVPWPAPNVWLGVSVEDQRTADERIPHLLQTPAAVRFVSAEPLLGPVNLRCVAPQDDWWTDALDTPDPSRRLDWVIVGGESGPAARPCDAAWVRSVVQQCKAASVACFVKQLGSKPVSTNDDDLCGFLGAMVDLRVESPSLFEIALRDPKGGDPAEWSMDLRVREFPAVRA